MALRQTRAIRARTLDALGGLNGFYNYLDAQQNLYNNTGGILVPINGFPSFIPLK